MEAENNAAILDYVSHEFCDGDDLNMFELRLCFVGSFGRIHNNNYNANEGLIVAVILGQSIDTPDNDRYNIYSTYTAMAHVSINHFQRS